MRLAIIPARGGSKRIPRKNIKVFGGKPMIAHAITAAKESGLFDHVIVTTDDDEIAKIAHEWGGETPFMRPADLSDDNTPTVPVIAHAIQVCKSFGWDIELICCIYPGVPFIKIDDIKGALALLEKSDTDYSFPMTEFPSAIQRALKRDSIGRMVPFYPQYELTRTQDLEPAFHDAGQFYWGTAQAWLSNPRIHSSGVGYQIPNWRVVDIDTTEDWKRAEILFYSLSHRKNEHESI
jgi:pseudaminic acid cytidylyltransferase